jgi:hypothetical protein
MILPVVLLLGDIALLWLLRYGCSAMVDYIKKTVTQRDIWQRQQR